MLKSKDTLEGGENLPLFNGKALASIVIAEAKEAIGLNELLSDSNSRQHTVMVVSEKALVYFISK